MTKKKTTKENALIEGKIDSKMINDFDGNMEFLSEDEKEAAKEAIKLIRDQKEKKRLLKEKEKNFEKNKKSLKEKIKKLSEDEIEILFSADICCFPLNVDVLIDEIDDVEFDDLHDDYEE